jgi:hypothetical protein
MPARFEASQASSSKPYLAGTAAVIHDKAAGNWKMMENASVMDVERLERATIHPAAAASPFLSKRNSVSETTNSAFPQFKQTNSSGNTQTMGFSRPFRPGKWMAISAVSFCCLSDPHDLHVTVCPFPKPILTRAVK